MAGALVAESPGEVLSPNRAEWAWNGSFAPLPPMARYHPLRCGLEAGCLSWAVQVRLAAARMTDQRQ